MSVSLVIEPRAAALELDGLTVGRILPYVRRRMVGPFIFFDVMGPAVLEPGQGMDVRPHPHIGLATVTYLFDGEIVHRDSLGCTQPIRPGEINWMTAGRGIAHSERMSEVVRAQGSRLHGIQLWVALPEEHEERAPSFDHYDAEVIPDFEVDGARVRLLAGSAFGQTSPVVTYSPLVYAEMWVEAGNAIPLTNDEELALYLVSGSVLADGVRYDANRMLVLDSPTRLEAATASHVMLLGGAPLGKRHIWWNFVSSSRERIELAKRDWLEGRFAKVVGDEIEFVPLPDARLATQPRP